MGVLQSAGAGAGCDTAVVVAPVGHRVLGVVGVLVVGGIPPVAPAVAVPDGGDMGPLHLV